MKKIFLLLILAHAVYCGQAQSINGKVVFNYITSASLKNSAGENPTRRISVYLPPGYDESSNRYPVIYYMHGFGENDTLTPVRIRILDMAISSGKIRPVIFVISDQKNLFGGSFYSNSTYTGNWADFTAKDLVEYMDKHYRTIPNRESRGLGGHSMGGHGAIKLGMLYPDVFSCVYALSPAMLALVKELAPDGESYKKLAGIKTKEELQKNFLPAVIVSMGRAWSPDPSKPPFYCDVPYHYNGENLTVDSAALKKWNANLPAVMPDEQLLNLKKLKAVKLDWGRNDSERMDQWCGMLSKRLEKMGVEHYAEEYIGTHVNKIWTDDGRVLNEMLPFFNSYLTFEKADAGEKDKK